MGFRRTVAAAAIAALTVAASAPAALASGPPVRTYQMTIANLTTGQWFTPAVVSTHRKAVDVFDVGSPASFEVKEVAENGNIGPLIASLTASIHVADTTIVQGVSGPPPIAPGSEVTFEITAEPGARALSWVSMLICTNDGFTGLDAVDLPEQVGDTLERGTHAYDAGTETNTESFADIVPPCGPLTGIDVEAGTGSGTSDPDIAEDGVIAMHPGIDGDADLRLVPHDWDGAVASVSITRTS